MPVRVREEVQEVPRSLTKNERAGLPLRLSPGLDLGVKTVRPAGLGVTDGQDRQTTFGTSPLVDL
jgi:hypothetical protein